MREQHLDYYATPGKFSALDGVDRPPGSVDDVVAAVQGLLVYDTVADSIRGAIGFTLLSS